MAKQATLKAEEREATGSGPARRLRRDGWVPGVVYGHGEESVALKVDARELLDLLESISVDNTLVDLQVGDDGTRKVLIREVQRHPWRSQLLHVDFFHIQEDEEIRVGVPIEFVGTPEGVREAGGILQTTRDSIEIECLPGEIPEFFELDVSELDIGDSLHVADLNTGGVRPLEDLDATLCVVVPPSVITVEEEEPEAEELELEELEPELVGEEGELPEEEGAEPGAEPEPGEEPPESPEDLL
jgi:large subunit ribosomal protein L25